MSVSLSAFKPKADYPKNKDGNNAALHLSSIMFGKLINHVIEWEHGKTRREILEDLIENERDQERKEMLCEVRKFPDAMFDCLVPKFFDPNFQDFRGNCNYYIIKKQRCEYIADIIEKNINTLDTEAREWMGMTIPFWRLSGGIRVCS